MQLIGTVVLIWMGLANFILETNPYIVGLQEVDLSSSSMSDFQDIPTQLAQRLHMYCAFSASRGAS